VACWHVTKPPARAVEFVVAGAWAPGQAEPPIAVGCTTSPSWSGLVKSAMTRAKMWMGSEEAPPLLKQLRAPGGTVVDSVLRWLRTGLDSWSWRRTWSLAAAWPVPLAAWSCGPSGAMPALRPSVGAWVLVRPAALLGFVGEDLLLAGHVFSAQAWQ
jgi:hypothetical protein